MKKINLMKMKNLLKSKKVMWTLAAVVAVVGVIIIAFGTQYYLNNRRPNFQKKYVLYVYPASVSTSVEVAVAITFPLRRSSIFFALL